MAPKEGTTRNSDVQNGSVHLSLQGKGGVGKSLVAAILVQYLLARDVKVHPVDTDPVNQTLSQYRELDVQPLRLLRDGRVDQRIFDVLLEGLLTEPGTFVIDSGAATFIPLWQYLLENNVFEALARARRRLVVHSVITGGQALADTLSGFNDVAEGCREASLVVWLNEYFGGVRDEEGTPFLEMEVCRRHAEKILGAVSILRRTQDTFGRDVEEMIAGKMTFQAAIRSSKFSIMAKQRLGIVRDHLFEQLDGLALLDPQKPKQVTDSLVSIGTGA
jgi:hypothetical protein